ncbi:MAG: acyl-CoA dehydrogenase family protein [bacterium]
MIDFTPTKDQNELVKMAKKFAKEIVKPAEIELDHMHDPEETFKSEIFKNVMKHACELGFNKMTIREDFGGLGLDAQTAGLLWEELAVGGIGITGTLLACSVVPLFISVLAPGRKDLVDQYVRPYCADATGEYITAWCSSEPNVGSDGSNYKDKSVRHKTTARKEGDEWVIDGAKSAFVSNGGIARDYLVFANVDPEKGICGSGVFLVPNGPGVSHGRMLDKLGMRALNQSDVFFDNARIPESYQIVPHGDNYPMIHNSIKTVGNIGVGYLALGLMRAAFEEALAYAKERVQFGKPLIEHQAIGFRLFECWQAIEASRALLWKASWTLAKQFMGDLKLSATARVFASNMAMKHTVEMVQVFGGYGISKEYNIEKYMRDAKLLQIMDATNEIMTTKAIAMM